MWYSEVLNRQRFLKNILFKIQAEFGYDSVKNMEPLALLDKKSELTFLAEVLIFII